ncbi:unnamed protein product [Phytophthora fragariaefolia]|uniref:Unnamed protein product n=1 Tax=Phytophthora fragariaefolia TaxID=1490495 RepID=A0A9W7D112_9STRA|nr:unnamed protein product [Phytophthora fragariaefolia]
MPPAAGSLESMQLMETVVNNINAKYKGMKREAKSVGKLSKVLEARGSKGICVRPPTLWGVDDLFLWAACAALSNHRCCWLDTLPAAAMEEKMNVIDDIDEELAELEDMVDQLEQYTGSLGSCACS